jgi:hypothetical protein
MGAGRAGPERLYFFFPLGIELFQKCDEVVGLLSSDRWREGNKTGGFCP